MAIDAHKARNEQQAAIIKGRKKILWNKCLCLQQRRKEMEKKHQNRNELDQEHQWFTHEYAEIGEADMKLRRDSQVTKKVAKVIGKQ